MKKYLTLLIFIFPLVSLATPESPRGIMGLLISFVTIVNWFVGLLMALATLIFLWGILNYVLAGDSESKRAEAKGYMTYGVVTLFVMVSVWALVYVISNTFGLQTGLNLPDTKSSIDNVVVYKNNK